ncbi:MAG: thioredoxin domain-containing protein [Candidatus Taylorbacteria bacterium]
MIKRQYNHFESGSISTPAAIIVAAAIIAIGLIVAFRPAGKTTSDSKASAVDSITQGPAVNMRAVTVADHILGNPNAPIKLVEYSDTACPFCRLFTPTLEKVMDNYGAGGQVAWVYRNFPLDKPDPNGNILHKNAGHESQALECAAQVGGNDKYWIFLKRLYAVTPSVTGQTPEGLDQAQLPIIAKFANIDVKAFNTCLDSGSTKDLVEADYTDGVNAGVNGTPFTIFVLSKPAASSLDNVISSLIIKLRIPTDQLFLSDDRTKIVMSGALPYENIKTIIDAVLGK